MNMDRNTIQESCKTLRRGLDKAKFIIGIIAEKLKANDTDYTAEKKSIKTKAKALREILEIAKQRAMVLDLVHQTYTTNKNKKITPENDIFEIIIPRFNGPISVGTKIRAYFDDFKPTIAESVVCTVVGFIKTKKSLLGKKPLDNFNVILLYEDGPNKGKVIIVGPSEKFFNQCDLIK